MPTPINRTLAHRLSTPNRTHIREHVHRHQAIVYLADLANRDRRWDRSWWDNTIDPEPNHTDSD